MKGIQIITAKIKCYNRGVLLCHVPGVQNLANVLAPWLVYSIESE